MTQNVTQCFIRKCTDLQCSVTQIACWQTVPLKPWENQTNPMCPAIENQNTVIVANFDPKKKLFFFWISLIMLIISV